MLIFVTFDTNTGRHRVDSLFYGHMAAPSSTYMKLWVAVKQVLLLSHGQASGAYLAYLVWPCHEVNPHDKA